MAVVNGGNPRPLADSTRFDLASLTKVMVTLPAILRLAVEGALTLDDPVGLFLPGFSGGLWNQVTIRRLLTHSGGLAPTKPYFETLTGIGEYLDAMQRSALEEVPGRRVAYSDLGFILLGEVVHQAAKRPIDQYARDRIWTRLGMHRTGFGPVGAEEAAATEVIEGQALIGVVHDENARALGGIAGHAGLFAPLDDVVAYVQAWVSPDNHWLSPWIRQASVRCQTPELDGRRGLGWVLRGDPFDVAGDFWPYTTVSHSGFTGTSLVWDPPTGAWAILLTNRVHFGRDRNISRLRRRFHNVAAQFLSVAAGQV